MVGVPNSTISLFTDSWQCNDLLDCVMTSVISSRGACNSSRGLFGDNGITHKEIFTSPLC